MQIVNAGKTKDGFTLWQIEGLPSNQSLDNIPSPAKLLDGKVANGDYITWQLGPFFKVIIDDTGIHFEKTKDQSSPLRNSKKTAL